MPTKRQIEALHAWAQWHGHNWKSKLRQAWMDGNYGDFADSAYLQQVRNSFGPSWLVRFQFHQQGGWSVTRTQ
jgi:hypothetical protein